MFLGMNNTRLERKILINLDFENGFLPTYLSQCHPLRFDEFFWFSPETRKSPIVRTARTAQATFSELLQKR